jgi:P27 family predicted phage terminase small subunit
MPKQMKLTTDKHARKDQRVRTQKLITETSGMDLIQKSCPKYLSSYARAMWTKLVPILQASGYVKQADKGTIEAFCINYQLLRKGYDSIKTDGVVTKVSKTVVNQRTGETYEDNAGWKRNPASQIIDSATAKLNSLAHELGLTPSARASLLLLSDDNDEEPNIKEMLNGGSEF